MARAFRPAVLFLMACITWAMMAASPAAAQFSDSYKFIQAVKKRDLAEAQKLLNKPGNTLVNIRDRDSGDTALHIVTRRRDVPWMAYMLQNRANANLADRQGDTPLIVAASSSFAEGVNLLIQYGSVSVDQANQRGETALIRAVHARDAASVRLLLAAGADPDRADNLAGMSAREYAARDRRGGLVSDLLAEAPEKDKGKMVGPSL